ncbi:hypothetical protein GCM10009654_28710 [Streptomyces hebeiensis]|uniref:Transposase IS200-like domain-containing protein n=1 Tax=Streptomyces hebeiensis TaxID=229486 RepID=A0ABN1UU73_9ACTN
MHRFRRGAAEVQRRTRSRPPARALPAQGRRLSRLVGSLKGVSARRLRQEFPDHIRKHLWGEHFWSPSYLAASTGGAPLAVIKEYIENQKRPDRGQQRSPVHPLGSEQCQEALPPERERPGFRARSR